MKSSMEITSRNWPGVVLIVKSESDVRVSAEISLERNSHECH